MKLNQCRCLQTPKGSICYCESGVKTTNRSQKRQSRLGFDHPIAKYLSSKPLDIQALLQAVNGYA